MVGRMLAHIDYLDESIAELSIEIERVIAPFSEEVELLDTIPGVDRRTAEVLIAEIGADMSQFPTHRHLASWAGICPGNDESAGKRRSGKTRKGSKWLRSALTEAAHAAARSRRTYLGAQYARLKGRRGPKKAAVAVGHSILVIVYHILHNAANPTRSLEKTTLTGGVQRKPTESVWSVNWRDSVIGSCSNRYLNLRRRASLDRIFTPVPRSRLRGRTHCPGPA
jgi:hypothetical protein